MDLLLWRWSTAVQLGSLLMIAGFFALLARTNPRAGLRWWRVAWVANLVALGVTLFFWSVQPGAAAGALVRGVYLATKLAFILCLLQGAWELRFGRALLGPRAAVGLSALWGGLGAIVLSTVDLVGVAQHGVMCVLFLGGSLVLARRPREGTGWLVAGLVLRGLVAGAESAAYLAQILAGYVAPATAAGVATFLSASSSLDTGAEWFLALGLVLAVSERSQRELRQANEELLHAQEGLRRLVDRDPLTALANRRALPEIFRAVQPVGAALLFVDLDDFKAVNDRHGHQAGDRALAQVAGALTECFRPDDHVVRVGGDEFLVVAPGMDPDVALERIGAVRARLRLAARGAPIVALSVGAAELVPGGNPDQALQAADAAMYRAKAEHAQASPV
ncbi:MAG: diguanylate cyclase [Vicinamibacterales bacterium]